MIRTAGEITDGAVTGALNIDAQADGSEDQLNAFDRGGRYLLYCRTGIRNGGAQELMDEMGSTSVVGAIAFSDLARAGASGRIGQRTD